MTSTSLRNRLNKPLRWLLPVVFWVAVWWAAAAAVGMSLLIPTPPEVLRTLGDLIVTSAFWRYTGTSLLRIMVGLVIGIAAGVVTAIATSRSALLRALLAPAVRVVRATPVASFILLVLLWSDRNYVPAVIAALVVLPIIWESTCAGIAGVDKNLMEFARAYRLTRLDTLRHVVLPAMLGHLSAAVCTAIGLAWKSGIAAEVLCTPLAAIGTKVYHAKLYLDTPALFAWTLVVILLSMTVERLARLLLLGRREAER